MISSSSSAAVSGSLQLGPDAGAGTEAQQPNRFAAVAQRQNEHPGTAVLAALRVAHHRAAAVIDLRLFAGCGCDDHPRFRRSHPAQFAHETLHALVASRKPVTVDQILPDPHRVAASRQPQLDRFPIQLAGTGRGLAAFCHRHCGRPRGRWSPPWPVLPRAAFSNRQAALPQSRLPSDSRPPSPDELRFPAQSAVATNPVAPAQSPAVASLRSRHCPCQPRLPAPQSKLLSWASNMAGFEVTLHGRFWVTPKANSRAGAVLPMVRYIYG